MLVRNYKTEDCEKLAKLFYETVHTINAKDYTKAQLDVWATGSVDLEQWDRSFQSHTTFVAEEAGEIVGFGDIDETGYLDRLYIHRDFQRRGAAAALCCRLERAVNAQRITTHASITARPFFEKRGYRVVREQQVERGGILLTNYVMEKQMRADA